MTRLVLYKTLHYFCTKLASFGLYGSRNVLVPRHYFIIISRKLLPISVMKFKIQNIIFNESTKFKSKHYFQLKEIAANFSYKIQNHRHYLNVSRNIIT